MDEKDYDEKSKTENQEEEFEKLWQIKAVREAVIKNLQVRVRRDDEKVTTAQEKIKDIFKQAWYKNLGGIYPTITEYINSATDLQVTYLSVIKEQEQYLVELNNWASKIEQNTQEVKTMQQLNNDLSLQLKEQEVYNTEQGKKIEELKKQNEELTTVLAEKGAQTDEDKDESDESGY